MNNIYLTGYMGKKEYSSYQTVNDKDLFEFSISVFDRKTDDGSNTYSFFKCKAWKELAKKISQLETGDKLLLVGKLCRDRWTDKQNNKREKVYVTVSNFEKLEKPTGASNQFESQTPSEQQSFAEEDIPF